MAQITEPNLKKGDNACRIDSMEIQAKEYYVTMVASMTIFGYLLIGAATTIIFSLILLLRNKKSSFEQMSSFKSDQQL
ncbi:MAG: hypothetical protein LC101_08695 [Flavobacteriales bacterium]|nr:hypothetical protein [Flavobacteriales bacterium]